MYCPIPSDLEETAQRLFLVKPANAHSWVCERCK
jgi:hypothetical protein